MPVDQHPHGINRERCARTGGVINRRAKEEFGCSFARSSSVYRGVPKSELSSS